jgi:hypothetical protein
MDVDGGDGEGDGAGGDGGVPLDFSSLQQRHKQVRARVADGPAHTHARLLLHSLTRPTRSTAFKPVHTARCAPPRSATHWARRCAPT